jgi:hypothetical protein
MLNDIKDNNIKIIKKYLFKFSITMASLMLFGILMCILWSNFLKSKFVAAKVVNVTDKTIIVQFMDENKDRERYEVSKPILKNYKIDDYLYITKKTYGIVYTLRPAVYENIYDVLKIMAIAPPLLLLASVIFTFSIVSFYSVSLSILKAIIQTVLLYVGIFLLGFLPIIKEYSKKTSDAISILGFICLIIPFVLLFIKNKKKN